MVTNVKIETVIYLREWDERNTPSIKESIVKKLGEDYGFDRENLSRFIEDEFPFPSISVTLTIQIDEESKELLSLNEVYPN